MTKDVKPRITASEDAEMDQKYRAFFERVAGSVRHMFSIVCGVVQREGPHTRTPKRLRLLLKTVDFTGLVHVA